jgi:tellurite resistance protein TerC
LFEGIGSPPLWIGFTILVLTLLTVDLLIFHRKPHVIGLKEAGMWTAGWVSLAMLFNTGVYLFAGTEPGLQFTAGYLVELALSVDNMFVFALIFATFAVPREYQHRVLFWGILGALVMRLTFILLGAAMLNAFHWVIYVFGGFLIFTGIRILLKKEDEGFDPEASRTLRIFRRFIPMTPAYHAQHFTIIENGKRYATPLLAWK